MILRPNDPPWQLSMGDSGQERAFLLNPSPAPRVVEAMGVASEGTQIIDALSLNRGCWDHTPPQSFLHKETVLLEEGCFHVMVRESSAGPS